MADAERKLNINKSHICDVCNNRWGRKSAGGFMWLYENDYEELKYSLEFTYNNNCGEYNKEPVVQLSLKGEFIKEYTSLSNAERETGIPRGNITSCLTGKNKTAGGYKWEYKIS